MNAFDGSPGAALVPMPIERFSHHAELDDEVAGQVLRLDFTPFLAPEPDESDFIITHDDPGVRASDKPSPSKKLGMSRGCNRPLI